MYLIPTNIIFVRICNFNFFKIGYYYKSKKIIYIHYSFLPVIKEVAIYRPTDLTRVTAVLMAVPSVWGDPAKTLSLCRNYLTFRRKGQTPKYIKLDSWVIWPLSKRKTALLHSQSRERFYFSSHGSHKAETDGRPPETIPLINLSGIQRLVISTGAFS